MDTNRHEWGGACRLRLLGRGWEEPQMNTDGHGWGWEWDVPADFRRLAQMREGNC